MPSSGIIRLVDLKYPLPQPYSVVATSIAPVLWRCCRMLTAESTTSGPMPSPAMMAMLFAVLVGTRSLYSGCGFPPVVGRGGAV